MKINWRHALWALITFFSLALLLVSSFFSFPSFSSFSHSLIKTELTETSGSEQSLICISPNASPLSYSSWPDFVAKHRSSDPYKYCFSKVISSSEMDTGSAISIIDSEKSPTDLIYSFSHIYSSTAGCWNGLSQEDAIVLSQDLGGKLAVKRGVSKTQDLVGSTVTIRIDVSLVAFRIIGICDGQAVQKPMNTGDLCYSLVGSFAVVSTSYASSLKERSFLTFFSKKMAERETDSFLDDWASACGGFGANFQFTSQSLTASLSSCSILCSSSKVRIFGLLSFSAAVLIFVAGIIMELTFKRGFRENLFLFCVFLVFFALVLLVFRVFKFPFGSLRFSVENAISLNWYVLFSFVYFCIVAYKIILTFKTENIRMPKKHKKIFGTSRGKL